MSTWEKHRKALEHGWPDQMREREPAPAKEQPLFADPFEPPAPHSIAEHEEFGIELAIPTDASQELVRLRQRQRTVLEILMIGKSIRAAGQLANVSRATIYRWMKTDAQFKSALQAWQERAQTTARSKLLCATEKAADVIIKKLDDGDLRAALAILKLGGIGPNAALVQEVNFDDPKTAKKTAPALKMRLRELLLSMTMPEQATENAALPEAAKPLLAPAAQLPAPAEKVEGVAAGGEQSVIERPG